MQAAIKGVCENVPLYMLKAFSIVLSPYAAVVNRPINYTFRITVLHFSIARS